MKTPPRFLTLLTNLLAAVPTAHAEISPRELVAPKVEISDGNVNFTIQPSVSGRNYWLQSSDCMAGGTWEDVGVVRSGDGSNIVISTPYVGGVQRRFYRIALVEATAVPAGFSLISAGSFQMGDQSNPPVGDSRELPVHTVQVSAFYMGKYEVTKELWDEVRAWGESNGYTDLPVGNSSFASKGANHPVHSISWYGVVKWCNARSQREGLTPCYTVAGATYKTGDSAPDCDWDANGYRLPTEAEWEKAARGGLTGLNFPWGNTITHNQANYYSASYPSYDISPTRGYHPTYFTGDTPFTSPVGSFPPNGYGLYDMAGNMWEWCWDWCTSDYYSSSPAADPRGPTSGWGRVYRGSSWRYVGEYCRVAYRSWDNPGFYSYGGVGFRQARSAVP